MTTPNPDAEPTARVESDHVVRPRHVSPEVQFAPGAVIAGRYRVAGILGKGGMGEVYRADDVKLGQTVALKFLPARLARDPILLARLHDEVRHGRQIAHPNVCRIYDIGEWEGGHFVAMEFVDGEDLARLLHRIGRLAHDKAVDIARGIAAGLMAAHAKNILHRDLKPANVMIDSHGEARITDFGLALSTADDQAGEVAGTPAYMAPEQLRGAPATIQSDLYSLGLVMYELFTGRRAHAARTLPERVRELTSDITVPSSHIRDIDPAVERVILRCLASDPAERPASGRAVIEALPGGDPLAAALAAGETPSPRAVAAAGSEGSLSRAKAWALLAIAALFAVSAVLIGRATSISNYVAFDKSPEVLLDRVQTLGAELGVPLPGKPLSMFYERIGYLSWLEAREGRRTLDATRGGPGPVLFRVEYGVTPQESELEPLMAMAPGRTSIDVDMAGRLSFLLAAPAPGDERPRRSPDWNELLAAAGLAPANLTQTPPRHAPPVPFDARAAWSGTFPDSRTPIRVEAAAWQGMPVFFRVTGEWEPADGMPERPAVVVFATAVMLLLVGIACALAWRNFRRRRGDRTGAIRLAILAFLLSSASAILQTGYPAGAVAAFVHGLHEVADSLQIGVIVYVLYLAIEPYVRQRWPERLISWSRLLAGRVRDPMVGRDMLIGLAAGAAYSFLANGGPLLARRTTGQVIPHLQSPAALLGSGQTIAQILAAFISGAVTAFGCMTLLVIASIVLRKRIAGAVVLFGVVMAMFLIATSDPPGLAIVVAALLAWIPYRFGLLATTMLFVTHAMLFLYPTVHVEWATGLAAIVYASVAALLLWSFRVSLGSQSPFGDVLEG